MYSDDDEDVFFDRSVMNKPLLTMVKELKKDQRFDEQIFEDAGALFYDLEELTIREGTLNEVLLLLNIDD